MSPRQKAVLVALGDVHLEDSDFSYASFAILMHRTGMTRAEVRRSCRALARKGLAEFGFGLWTDEGTPAGSGYTITAAGRAMLPAVAA